MSLLCSWFIVCVLLLNDASAQDSRTYEHISPSPEKITYGALTPNETELLFDLYLRDYDKLYRSNDFRRERLDIFRENLLRYDKMNEADRGTAVYGIDQFSDWTFEEFKQRISGIKKEPFDVSVNESMVYYDDPSPGDKKIIPENFDWRDEGVVGRIKEQGFICGSCSAFATVATLEILYSIKHRSIKYFSEQQLLDCDTRSRGCGGGWSHNMIKYVQEAGGLESDKTYPYKGENATSECLFDKDMAILKVRRLIMVEPDSNMMTAHVCRNGPLAVSLSAESLYGYRGGVMHPPSSGCSKDLEHADHAATIVGYGVSEVRSEDDRNRKRSLPYWIVKNSWGKNYGGPRARGYFYIYRGDNTCGIENKPTGAVVE
nr:PREDICTED: putative cysteine proteinase CG12163 isoform X2 [Bemisia tabaci]